jgi:hypothetical protein
MFLWLRKCNIIIGVITIKENLFNINSYLADYYNSKFLIIMVERVYKRLDLGRERGGRKKNIAAYL